MDMSCWWLGLQLVVVVLQVDVQHLEEDSMSIDKDSMVDDSTRDVVGGDAGGLGGVDVAGLDGVDVAGLGGARRTKGQAQTLVAHCFDSPSRQQNVQNHDRSGC